MISQHGNNDCANLENTDTFARFSTSRKYSPLRGKLTSSLGVGPQDLSSVLFAVAVWGILVKPNAVFSCGNEYVLKDA